MLANQLLLDHGPDLGIKVINQVLAIQDLRIGLEMEAFGRTIREFVIYSNLPYVSWVVETVTIKTEKTDFFKNQRSAEYIIFSLPFLL